MHDVVAHATNFVACGMLITTPVANYCAKFKTFVFDCLKMTYKHFYMAEENVIDNNRQDKNFRRSNAFHCFKKMN